MIEGPTTWSKASANQLGGNFGLDATVWPHLFGGCHLGRDTAAAIERAGFTIGWLDRFLFPGTRTPISFHITGRAASRAR